MKAINAQFPVSAGHAEPFTVLSQDGILAPDHEPTLTDKEVVSALDLMLLTRAFDDKGLRLQRQGRFGTFSQVRGQEAAVTGSAIALDPERDWVVPQYRELPALLRQGYPLKNFILYFSGDPRGGHVPNSVNCLPLNIALASQLPHAVGLAWGLQRRGDGGVVIAYFGDGASSEGDTHEAMNLAGVLKAPVVFFLSNNGWAISTPRSRQSAAPTLASRSIGYGMPGMLVDGNDLLAVHTVTSQAVARARDGEGPTLIEAVTYRVAAHNTADDPTRYVDSAAAASWVPRDPIARIEAYLSARGLWNQTIADTTAARNAALIDSALADAANEGAPSESLLFEHLYAQPPGRVRTQQGSLNLESGI